MYTRKVKMWKGIPKEVCGEIIREELKQDYYNVYFFDNAEEMYEYFDKRFKDEKDEKNEHNYCGICKYSAKEYVYEDGRREHSKVCGVIMYILDEYGADTATHEIAHAVTFYFAYRLKDMIEDVFGVDNDDLRYNELFCYMCGRMARQINNMYYDIKKCIDKE